MILNGTLISLQAVLSGAVSANQPECHVAYVDYNREGLPTPPAEQRAALSGASDVVILAAPSFNPTREVLTASIYNKDTASITVTVKTDDGTTERIIIKATLLTLEVLCYEKGQGWYALDANGNRKEVTSSVFSSLTVTGNETVGGTLSVTGATSVSTLAASGAFTGTTATLTKATAGDVATFTNGGASPYALYVYSGSSVSAIARGAGGTQEGLFFTGSAATLYGPGQTASVAVSATGASVTGTLAASATIKAGGYTVGTLPAGATGQIAYVTDQLTTVNAKGAAPTGGGAVVCYQIYNGAAWVGI